MCVGPLRKLATASVWLLCLLVTASFPQERSKHPNIVLIITDDQGYGDLGLHGNRHIRTPRLDRLGRESIQLTQFYASPVCSPTRASLMTGRYNYRTGVVDTYLGRSLMHPDEVTIAEMLQAAGYRTGIFGKWHLGDNYPLRPIDQGFHEALVHRGGGIGQPSDPDGNRYLDPVLQHNGKPEKHRGYCTDVFTDAAIRFMEQNRHRPFFVYLAANAPHSPLQIDESFAGPYRGMGLSDEVARVYGMVANIDLNVGRLLDRMDSLGLRDSTIVVFMTDNGPAASKEPRFNAGMRGAKGTAYEGGIRVPGFVRWPARLKPGRIDRTAAHIDLAPTILDACGVETPDQVKFDGRSLMPLLLAAPEGPRAEWPDRTLFFQWHRGDEPEPFRNSAVRTQRYKLVHGSELYDLVADPAEAHDLSSERKELVAGMRADYERWFRDVSATRGYAPPRIRLGTEHENPVILTRQDWRGPRAGWNEDSLGHWEVEVAGSGAYDVTLQFPAGQGWRVLHLKLGNVQIQSRIKPRSSTHTFGAVALPAGPARLEAWIESSGQTVGVRYAIVAAR